MRDWTQTQFLTSFKGAPFWLDDNDVVGGRRNAYSELPGVDLPLSEDLGGKKREVEIRGYTIGDFSDAQMDAVEAMCNSPGPGSLVLPAQGVVQARCDEFRRGQKKIEQGKFSFTARFTIVAATAAASAAPPEYLAQLAFDAVAGLRSAAPGFLAQARI